MANKNTEESNEVNVNKLIHEMMKSDGELMSS